MTEAEATLRRLGLNDEGAVRSVIAAGLHVSGLQALEPATCALLQLSVLVGLRAPVVSYQSAVEFALASGASVDTIVDVLRAVAPIVGRPRTVAAANALMLVLGYEMEAALEGYEWATAQEPLRK